MAVMGTGQEFDISLKAGAAMKTTTAQYRVVGLYPTSTNADKTVYFTNAGAALNNTNTAFYALGINQTYMSASTEECNVRMFGVSKAICASSITAGDFIQAYDGASTTTRFGTIETSVNSAAVTATATVTATLRTVLGRALEDGSTGTVISVFLNPQKYEAVGA